MQHLVDKNIKKCQETSIEDFVLQAYNVSKRYVESTKDCTHLTWHL